MLFRHRLKEADVEHDVSTSRSTTPTYDPRSPLPSLSLLFWFINGRDAVFLLMPAMLLSAAAGGVAPFMSFVIGQAFEAFAQFALAPSEQLADARHRLLHQIGLAVIELIALSAGALVLSTLTSTFWISVGERNTRRLRMHIYRAMSRQDMSWFDGHNDSEDHGGAADLTMKFARETDDIRNASSLAAGMTFQYLITALACIGLAFSRSWQLTLVILASLPVTALIARYSQILSSKYYSEERTASGRAASVVERAVSGIATVKAFNASASEAEALSRLLDKQRVPATRLIYIWAGATGIAQFTAMAMFVQGFWFGSFLVRRGIVSAGDVMTAFWACLIVASNLQLLQAQMMTLVKGQTAMASLLVDIPAPSHQQRIAQIDAPKQCLGELTVHRVDFAYASRPETLVLSKIKLFASAGDFTFIVGGSGSGKSTLAQLLAGLYNPSAGSISLDNNDIDHLPRDFVRSHVALVSQTCVVFDGTIRENIVMGRLGGEVSNEEIDAACRFALLWDFVLSLSNGLDTYLGASGARLSGGQRQRLALARAYIRNPTILILDEATSALDGPARTLVFEAIRTWRRNRTTVVVTHDLPQILPDDFVCVLEQGGVVAEEGYRADLVQVKDGVFAKMCKFHEEIGRSASSDVESVKSLDDDATIYFDVELDETLGPTIGERRATRFLMPPHQSIGGAALRGETWTAANPDLAHKTSWIDLRASPLMKRTRSKRLAQHRAPSPNPSVADTIQGEPRSVTPTVIDHSESWVQRVDQEKFYMEKTAQITQARRSRQPVPRLTHVVVDKLDRVSPTTPAEPYHEFVPFRTLVAHMYKTIPNKPLLCLGVVVALINGAITPLFSYVLSRLLFQVSIGAQAVHTITILGGIVLAITFADGLFTSIKMLVMETVALRWVNHLRRTTFPLVLHQDKTWFDRSENNPTDLASILIKDGDDARSLIATVVAQALVVLTMLLVGLVWAIIRGWQLTLAALAIAPIFAGAMALQARLVDTHALRNKRARERVARDYHEALQHVRAIRGMSLEPVLETRFRKSVMAAHKCGMRGAFVEGCTYGLATALIYLTEGVLFYIGALLVARGTYSYARMLEILQLLIFSVSMSSQLMTFTVRIVPSLQATRDFYRLLRLPTETQESHGTLRPVIRGDVHFKDVHFAYPERSQVPVLRELNLNIRETEFVAIVGASGSGKSTIAALLQRLYEPSYGTIFMNDHPLHATDSKWLRYQMAVVSQTPHLIDASITDNIAYGASGAVSPQIVREAAHLACLDDFVGSLPNGYDTLIGENAALLSGGQAQRLQIARALIRGSRLLVLDEATSALDGATEESVLASVRAVRARAQCTTIIITHKVPVMRMCDRILVLDDGVVVEDGTYDALMHRRGKFASLAQGGQWTGH